MISWLGTGAAAIGIAAALWASAGTTERVEVQPASTPLGCTGTTITWTGAGGTTDWDTAANWTPAAVPAATDYVCIPDGTPAAATPSGSTPVIKGLQADGPVTISNGLQATDAGFASHLVETTWTSGNLTGSFTVPDGGRLTLSGAGAKTLRGSLTNEGDLVVEGTGTAIGCTRGTPSGVNNLGAITISVASTGAGLGPASGSTCTPLIRNQTGATITKGTASGSFEIATAIVNDGSITTTSGTLVLSGGSRHTNGTGTGSNTSNNGQSSGSYHGSGGTIEFRTSETTLTSAATVTGSTALSSGSLTGPITLPSSSTLEMTGGTRTGTTTVASGATLDLTGSAQKMFQGRITNEGTVKVRGPNTHLICSNGSASGFDNGGVLEIRTSVNATAGNPGYALYGSGSSSCTAAVRNRAGASITKIRNAPADAATDATLWIAVINEADATVRSTVGRLNLAGGTVTTNWQGTSGSTVATNGTSAGTFHGDGGTVAFSRSTHHLSATTPLAGDILVTKTTGTSGGMATVAGALTVPSGLTLKVQGGVLAAETDASSGSVIEVSGIGIVSGVVDGPGTLDVVEGVIQADIKGLGIRRFQAGSLDGVVTIRSGANLQVTGTASKIILARVINNGQFTVTGTQTSLSCRTSTASGFENYGSVAIQTTLNLTGSPNGHAISSGAGGACTPTIFNHPGASITKSGSTTDATISAAVVNASGASVTSLAGTLNLGGGTVTTNGRGTGTTVVDPGVSEGSYAGSGGTIAFSRGTHNLTAATPLSGPVRITRASSGSSPIGTVAGAVTVPTGVTLTVAGGRLDAATSVESGAAVKVDASGAVFGLVDGPGELDIIHGELGSDITAGGPRTFRQGMLTGSITIRSGATLKATGTAAKDVWGRLTNLGHLRIEGPAFSITCVTGRVVGFENHGTVTFAVADTTPVNPAVGIGASSTENCTPTIFNKPGATITKITGTQPAVIHAAVVNEAGAEVISTSGTLNLAGGTVNTNPGGTGPAITSPGLSEGTYRGDGGTVAFARRTSTLSESTVLSGSIAVSTMPSTPVSRGTLAGAVRVRDGLSLEVLGGVLDASIQIDGGGAVQVWNGGYVNGTVEGNGRLELFYGNLSSDVTDGGRRIIHSGALQGTRTIEPGATLEAHTGHRYLQRIINHGTFLQTGGQTSVQCMAGQASGFENHHEIRIKNAAPAITPLTYVFSGEDFGCTAAIINHPGARIVKEAPSAPAVMSIPIVNLATGAGDGIISESTTLILNRGTGTTNHTGTGSGSSDGLSPGRYAGDGGTVTFGTGTFRLEDNELHGSIAITAATVNLDGGTFTDALDISGGRANFIDVTIEEEAEVGLSYPGVLHGASTSSVHSVDLEGELLQNGGTLSGREIRLSDVGSIHVSSGTVDADIHGGTLDMDGGYLTADDIWRGVTQTSSTEVIDTSRRLSNVRLDTDVLVHSNATLTVDGPLITETGSSIDNAGRVVWEGTVPYSFCSTCTFTNRADAKIEAHHAADGPTLQRFIVKGGAFYNHGLIDMTGDFPGVDIGFASNVSPLVKGEATWSVDTPGWLQWVQDNAEEIVADSSLIVDREHNEELATQFQPSGASDTAFGTCGGIDSTDVGVGIVPIGISVSICHHEIRSGPDVYTLSFGTTLGLADGWSFDANPSSPALTVGGVLTFLDGNRSLTVQDFQGMDQCLTIDGSIGWGITFSQSYAHCYSPAEGVPFELDASPFTADGVHSISQTGGVSLGAGVSASIAFSANWSVAVGCDGFACPLPPKIDQRTPGLGLDTDGGTQVSVIGEGLMSANIRIDGTNRLPVVLSRSNSSLLLCMPALAPGTYRVVLSNDFGTDVTTVEYTNDGDDDPGACLTA